MINYVDELKDTDILSSTSKHIYMNGSIKINLNKFNSNTDFLFMNQKSISNYIKNTSNELITKTKDIFVFYQCYNQDYITKLYFNHSGFKLHDILGLIADIGKKSKIKYILDNNLSFDAVNLLKDDKINSFIINQTNKKKCYIIVDVPLLL